MVLKQLGDLKAPLRSSERMGHKLMKPYVAAIGNSSILDSHGGESVITYLQAGYNLSY